MFPNLRKNSVSSLRIPASVERIGKNAFEYGSTITELTFAEGSKLKVIEEGAFRNCGRYYYDGTAIYMRE